MKIVLVEDDLMLAEIYETRLSLAGYDCIVAHDGLKGLQLVKEIRPSLVLLDLMLPEMSGDQVLAAMRDSDWGKEIKVVILTNISESEAPPDIESLQFEQYIVKANLQHNQLAETVEQIIGKP
jgi:DNA-binding response OmpR family regulator